MSTTSRKSTTAKVETTTRKPKARKKPQAKPVRSSLYAAAGVAIMAITSMGLNGYAFSLHATVPVAGWALGVIIPVFVLILFKVAGDKFTAHKGFALLTGVTGSGVLLLSVWHCSESIALLTGSPLLLALPMAVACDIGLVCCEVALLLDTTK
jgi:hypothetical protein